MAARAATSKKRYVNNRYQVNRYTRRLEEIKFYREKFTDGDFSDFSEVNYIMNCRFTCHC